MTRRYTERGLPTAPEQNLVTAGAQHAFEICCCGAWSARSTRCWWKARPTRTRWTRWPGRAPGWWRWGWRRGAGDIEAFVATLRQSLPRLAYLMPDFHNPAGHLMSAPTGRRWPRPPRPGRAWSSTRPSPSSPSATVPLAAWDPAGQVITIGSMASPLGRAAGRVGPGRFRPDRPLQAARGPSDLASPVVEQLAAAWLLERRRPPAPGPARVAHPPPPRRRGRARRAPAPWNFRTPGGGLSLWARLDAPVSSALAHAAERQRLRLVPGPRFGGGANLEGYLRAAASPCPKPSCPTPARRPRRAPASRPGPPCRGGPRPGSLSRAAAAWPLPDTRHPSRRRPEPGIRPLSPARSPDAQASVPGMGDDGGLRVVVVNECGGPDVLTVADREPATRARPAAGGRRRRRGQLHGHIPAGRPPAVRP